MARVNITVLGINELKWTGMGEINSKPIKALHVRLQYATGDHWRNNSRKNEGMEPK